VKGDAINVLLAAAAYNFKRAMRALWGFIKTIIERSVLVDFSTKWAF